MAKRRMFSLDVVDTDSFLDLPASSQSLYFHLGMRADDDGFVSSPKRITAMVGAAGDDLKLLIAKGFVTDALGRAQEALQRLAEENTRGDSQTLTAVLMQLGYGDAAAQSAV